MFINGVTDIIIGNNNYTSKEYDLIFRHIPKIDYSTLKTLFYTTISVSIFRILLLPISEWVTSIKRFFVLGSTIALIRSVSVIVTIFPNPFHECESRLEITKSYESAFYNALTLRDEMTCNDVMFSGHVSLLTSLALSSSFSVFRFRVQHVLEKLNFLLLFLVSFIIIPGSRFHYTVDCYIGFIITTLVWYYYIACYKFGKLINNYYIKPTFFIKLVLYIEEETFKETIQEKYNMLSSSAITYTVIDIFFYESHLIQT
tara:strand:- start:78 stop:851 length:774 start_codon:yes stop_codon:yes gene_type:complete